MWEVPRVSDDVRECIQIKAIRLLLLHHNIVPLSTLDQIHKVPQWNKGYLKTISLWCGPAFLISRRSDYQRRFNSRYFVTPIKIYPVPPRPLPPQTWVQTMTLWWTWLMVVQAHEVRPCWWCLGVIFTPPPPLCCFKHLLWWLNQTPGPVTSMTFTSNVRVVFPSLVTGTEE